VTGRTRTTHRGIGVLVASNILGGVGVASGIAVGALLVEQVGGTSVAGLGQAMSVLGAAVAAVPLVAVATRWGRRWALTLGYVLAVLGGALVVVAALLGWLVLLLPGLGLFGVAQATNLQSRYAASELAPVATRARTMSVVVWVTTIGSVAGPNLTAAGARLGEGIGVPALAGPYLFSVVAFALAGTVLGLFFRPATAAGDDVLQERSGARAAASAASATAAPPAPVHPVGALGAMRWAGRHPVARFAVVLITAAHATMVMVMAMTPLHMHHDGMSLEVVGIVISAHILGMYALSPVFGWLTDRYGGLHVAFGGIGIFAAAIALGLVAAAGAGLAVTMTALVLLGLGWSASLIASSSMLAGVDSGSVRVPLQGATDALMNYAGAGAAAVAGPVLALDGFRGVNLVASALLVPAVVLAVVAVRRRGPGEEAEVRAAAWHDAAPQAAAPHDAAPHDAAPHDAAPHDAAPHARAAVASLRSSDTRGKNQSACE
jgi:MFS family permease